ncbi:MAG: tRNA uridine-5-carboxymethylaminomethyl(34) synthesis GTPase MnmE [Candidatus Omnitrophota bacterium]
MKNNSPDDTIAALSTPIGEGGISIARLSGPKALMIADAVFASKDKDKPSKFKTYTVHYGHIVDEKNRVVDEVLLTVMKAPKSYTKEDVVEINCHGGIQAAKRALELILERGARLAEPGEFTKRAFLNGRLDLAQAEAVLDVIRSKTEGSLKVAMSQLDGGLSNKVNAILDSMIDAASQIEASIDFPEEDIEIIENSGLVKKVEGVIRGLQDLVRTYRSGAVLREGVLAIICGKPNVGKSSLMNLLLNRDRVIVSPIPGTTRDAVEEVINLKGVPVRLVDTAGIADAKDALDKEGVKRSKKYLDLADIVILVLDGSTAIGKEDLDIIKLALGKKKIVVINKSDLPKKTDAKKAKKFFKDDKIVEISVGKRRNIGTLEKELLGAVWSGEYDQGESAVVANARHKELLDRALDNMLSVKKALAKRTPCELVAVDLKEALYHLGLIVGKSVSDDILDRIFEQFCIGK